MVHIPVYDMYSFDHGDIYHHVLIYDGNELIYPEEGDDYGFCPPEQCAFPDFPLEYHSPLGRSGRFMRGFRWVTSEIMRKYNAAMPADIKPDSGYYIKVLTIDGHDYYFVGDELTYEAEPRQIMIDEPCNYTDEDETLDVDEYFLAFCEKQDSDAKIR